MALLISRQSISQKRADTVVVKETHELTKVSGVEPVTSSHCAFEGPPVHAGQMQTCNMQHGGKKEGGKGNKKEVMSKERIDY